jgi:hypothetical protein
VLEALSGSSGSVAADVVAPTVSVESEVVPPACEVCPEELDGQVPAACDASVPVPAEFVSVVCDVSDVLLLAVSGLALEEAGSEELGVVALAVGVPVPVAELELLAGPEDEVVVPTAGVDVVWGSRRSFTGEKNATSTFAVSEPPPRGAVTTSATNETGGSLASGPSSH